MARFPCDESTKARIMARGDLRESEKIALIGAFPDGTEVNATNDPRFADTKYILQASHEEVFLHWCYMRERAKHDPMYKDFAMHEQGGAGGYTLHYGKLGGLSLCVELFWHKVMGELFLSYEPCSQVVHWPKCEEFVRKLCPNSLGHTNISNYHNLCGDIRDWKKRKHKTGS